MADIQLCQNIVSKIMSNALSYSKFNPFFLPQSNMIRSCLTFNATCNFLQVLHNPFDDIVPRQQKDDVKPKLEEKKKKVKGTK